jgi:HK97 family phage major capsid protein
MTKLEQIVAQLIAQQNSYKQLAEDGIQLATKEGVTVEEVNTHSDKVTTAKAKLELLQNSYKTLKEEEDSATAEAKARQEQEGTQNNNAKKGDPNHFADFYRAVMNGAKVPEGNPFFNSFVSPDDIRHSAALLGNFGNAGAYIASEQLISYFIQAIDDAFPLIGRSSTLVLRGAGQVSARELVGDLSDATWDDEEFSNLTEDNIEIGRRNLTPQLLTKIVKIGRTFAYNAPGFESKINERLTQAFGRSREKAMIRGTGNKQPLGITLEHTEGLSAANFVDTATTLTIGYEDLINMYTSLKSQYRNRAVWVCHRDVLNDLMKLKDQADNYIWSPARDNANIAVEGSPGTLLGLPVIDNEFMDNKTSNAWVADDTPMILADFSHYWNVTNETMTMQRLTELYATENKIGLLAHMSVDGAPVLNEAFSVLKIS